MTVLLSTPLIIIVYSIIVAIALFIFLLTTLANLPLFPKLQRDTQPHNAIPAISILIPARNEAAVIEQTVQRILAQTYNDFELIILDDGSTDGTADLAKRAAAGDKRLKLIHGTPLPSGWLGKNWACHQLGQAAVGELLIFVDADVQWAPEALLALLHMREQGAADLLTIWPTQITLTWGERLVIPLMKFAILSYLPIIGVHYTPYATFAAANGQCLLFRRTIYDKIGGHAAVRDNILEDVALSRLIKKNGFKLYMADGNQLIACRMYNGWSAVRDGFGKNILAGHRHSLAFLLLSTIGHWSMFIWPWVWLLLGGRWWAVGLIALGFINRLLVGLFVGRGWARAAIEAILMPVSVLLMTRIALQGVRWRLGAGPQWKGRIAQVESQKAQVKSKK